MKHRTHCQVLFILFIAMILSAKAFNAFSKFPIGGILRRSSLDRSCPYISRQFILPATSHVFTSKLSLHDGAPKANSKRNRGDISLMPEFFECVHRKDFTKAEEMYTLILATNSKLVPQMRKNLITSMLSLCDKGDQLEYALRLRNDLVASGIRATESDISALIKCACDRGDTPLAKQYLQEIVDTGHIVRHRNTLPILQATLAPSCASSSYQGAEECLDLSTHGLYPRPQELEELLASGVRTGAIKESAFLQKLSNILTIINHTYCAIDHVSALRMHQALHDGTAASEEPESVAFLAKIMQRGILVNQLHDITGTVLRGCLPAGQVAAQRASFIGHSSDELQLLRQESFVRLEKERGRKLKLKGTEQRRQFRPEPATVERLWTKVPAIAEIAALHEVPADRVDLYEVLAPRSASSCDENSISPVFAQEDHAAVRGNPGSLGAIHTERHCVVTALCPHNHAKSSAITPTSFNYFLRPSAPNQASSDDAAHNPAACVSPPPSDACRLVEISKTTSTCPNCGDTLKPIFMSAEDMAHVKDALQTLTFAASAVAGEKLEEFGQWLAAQEDFDFVIDAANVAYFNQNFKDGKFSYQQIELVYDALKQSHIVKNPRVLVLIPDAYLQRNRRNAAAGRRTNACRDDLRIIARLKAENSMYCVPNLINDDWFVIYATLCGKRNGTVAERRGTGEPWRPTYAVSNDLCRDHKLSFLSPRPFFRWRSSQVVFFDIERPVTGKNNKKKQDVTLTFPGLVTKEFQQSTEKPSRWHLPIEDRQSWLCLNI